MTIPTRGNRSSTISVDSDIDFTEFVEVKATFNAPDFRGLQVELVSPSGKVSVLSVPESANCPYERADGTMLDCQLIGSFRFGSARHLGEDPSGTWTLRLADRSGKLAFKSSPDREMPTDQGGDNTYDVVVTVSDGAQSDDVDVAVTVTDDNEPFEIEGGTAFDHDENATHPIETFRVVNDPENRPIVWELSGTDRGDFTTDDVPGTGDGTQRLGQVDAGPCDRRPSRIRRVGGVGPPRWH